MAKVAFFQNDEGRWFYTIIAGNGRKVGWSSETDGFPTEREAKRAFRSAQKSFAAIPTQ